MDRLPHLRDPPAARDAMRWWGWGGLGIVLWIFCGGPLLWYPYYETHLLNDLNYSMQLATQLTLAWMLWWSAWQ